MVDKTKFVVLDVETNGLSSTMCDLLSISVYKPDTDEYYDRFLPLELNSRVETTEFNGITKDMLKGKTALSQTDFDELVNHFELDKRTILTYGNLDKNFIKNYLKRHKINGFDKLNFRNFKDNIISTAYSNGLLTKDNLCKAFGIAGVTETHSGHNDCLLEWKLFEYIDERFLFVTYSGYFCPENIEHNSENWYIYEFSDQYIVPVSYLHTHPKLKKILELPKIDIEYEVIFEHYFSNKCNNIYSSQPAGVASEHFIYHMLDAKEQIHRAFLLSNKKKLKYLGCIIAPAQERIVLFDKNDDGTLRAINREDDLYIQALNQQTEALKKEIIPVVDFIKSKIFKDSPIYSQELVINKNYNLLGLCDFSNEFACMENKWYFSIHNQRYLDEHKYQAFITSNGRPMYMMVGSENKITIYKINISLLNQ